MSLAFGIAEVERQPGEELGVGSREIFARTVS